MEKELPNLFVKNKLDDFVVKYGLCATDEGSFSNEKEEKRTINKVAKKNVNNINEEDINYLETEAKRLTCDADTTDYLLAAASGFLCGIVDIAFSNQMSLTNAQNWGTEHVNDFVIKIARLAGCRKNDLLSCVSYLEGHYHHVGDEVKNEYGGAGSHHLWEYSHHFGFTGLLFSILTQFTGMAYGADTNGKFKMVPVDQNSSDLIGDTFESKIWYGTINWFFHMASDLAGSRNSTRAGRAGSGLPGPILSIVKILSSSPIFKTKDGKLRKELSETLSKLFHGTLINENGQPIKFDFRTEIGILHEKSKQVISVLLNDIIVRSTYFIRRLAFELQNKENLKDIDWNRTKPINNRTITRLLMVSNGALMTVSLPRSIIVAKGKSGGNSKKFVVNLLFEINYAGMGAFVLSIGQDIFGAIRRHRVMKKLVEIDEETNYELKSETYVLINNSWEKLTSDPRFAIALSNSMQQLALTRLTFQPAMTYSTLSMINANGSASGYIPLVIGQGIGTLFNACLYIASRIMYKKATTNKPKKEK